MSESMLDWMRRFQRKYAASISNESPAKLISEAHFQTNPSYSEPTLSPDIIEDKNPQTTLDSFVKKTQKSLIYDENFGVEDLRLLTRRWREQNLLVE